MGILRPSGLSPLLAFPLAALGQFAILHQGLPATLPLGLFFFVLAAACLLGPPPPSCPLEDRKAGQLSPRLEVAALAAILVVALFFRLHRLDSIPRTLFVECANVGLGGLRILHEGWRPFYETSLFEHPALMLYLSAAWFKFLPPTQLNMELFYVLYSLAAFPFIYWTFRQLAGPKAALLTLFILSVMRCHVFYSRWGHSMVQPPVYFYAALALGLYWVRTGKHWPLWAAVLPFSLGIYTYNPFKIVPLFFAACLVHESIRDREKVRRSAGTLLMAGSTAFLLCSPLAWNWLQHGSFGKRESDLFIGNIFTNGDSFRTFLDNIVGVSLMFNRSGFADALTNIPGLRWFDDVLGALWPLGLALALWGWRRHRAAFYSLSALLVLSLADLLTTDPLNIGRLLQIMPFFAFLAAWALLRGVEASLTFRSKGIRQVLRVTIAVALMGMALQNYRNYFMLQADHPDSLLRNDLVVGRVAKEISDKGDSEDFYLSSRFSGHNTVQFLNYFHPQRYRALPAPAELGSLKARPGSKGVHVILDEGKGGILGLLEDLYPQGVVHRYRSADGVTRGYDYWIPAGSGPSGRGGRPPTKLEKGLRGRYWRGVAVEGRPDLQRPEPVLNFTFFNDFPLPEVPFSAIWDGSFLARDRGPYAFFLLTHPDDHGELSIDGRKVIGEGAGSGALVELGPGWHRLEVSFRKDRGFFSAMNLLWRPPGQERYEVMPNGAFSGVPGEASP